MVIGRSLKPLYAKRDVQLELCRFVCYVHCVRADSCVATVRGFLSHFPASAALARSSRRLKSFLCFPFFIFLEHWLVLMLSFKHKLSCLNVDLIVSKIVSVKYNQYFVSLAVSKGTKGNVKKHFNKLMIKRK